MVGESPADSAHEGSHSVSAQLRNENKGKVNGFYVLSDRAIVLPEPNLRKSQVAQFIPQELRGSRFSTYITGQSAWDDTPLYIYDEWNAYINGMMVLTEKVYPQYQNMDFTCGPLEFMFYAIGLVDAIKQLDPSYLNNTPDFMEFTLFQIERSLKSRDLQKDYPWDQSKFYLDKWDTEYKDKFTTKIDRSDFDMI